MTPGQVRRGFANIRELLGTPAHVAKPAKPGPGRPKGSASGPAPRYPVPKKSDTKGITGRTAESQRLKHKLNTFLDSFRAAIGLYFFELSFQ